MSTRYANSPALQLRIGESGLRGLLHGGLCVTTLFALCSVNAQGYTMSAGPLSFIAFGLLWLLRRNPMLGAELCWRKGRWTLKRDGILREIFPSRRSTMLSSLIYIAFTDKAGDSAGHIWLYSDSVSHNQLRRLRVRLTLLQ